MTWRPCWALPAVPYDASDKHVSRVSSLSLVRYRTNDYSVSVAYGHRDVLVRGYVGEVVISNGAEVIARHPRSYERDDFIFDPVHYLPLLTPSFLRSSRRRTKGASRYGRASRNESGRRPPRRANPSRPARRCDTSTTSTPGRRSRGCRDSAQPRWPRGPAAVISRMESSTRGTRRYSTS